MALGITTLRCLVKTLGDTHAFSSSPEGTHHCIALNNVALLLLQILASTKDRFTNPRIAGIAPDYLDHVCFSNGLTVFESVDNRR